MDVLAITLDTVSVVVVLSVVMPVPLVALLVIGAAAAAAAAAEPEPEPAAAAAAAAAGTGCWSGDDGGRGGKEEEVILQQFRGYLINRYGNGMTAIQRLNAFSSKGTIRR